jgi:ribosomal protein S18 acetylase RimI-like enzyme
MSDLANAVREFFGLERVAVVGVSPTANQAANALFRKHRESAQPEEILPFRDEFADAFRRLNLQWLEGYGLLEEADLPYLNDPRHTIIDAGGAILVATKANEVLGTVAILARGDRIFELAKLAVAPQAQGRGLGRRLASSAIASAAALGARQIVLCSNTRLVAALRLYESLGFRHSTCPTAATGYDNADVHMVLDLPDAGQHP